VQNFATGRLAQELNKEQINGVGKSLSGVQELPFLEKA